MLSTMRGWKALIEERTGAAKPVVQSRKKKEIYDEMRIAVSSGGSWWVVMSEYSDGGCLYTQSENLIFACALPLGPSGTNK